MKPITENERKILEQTIPFGKHEGETYLEIGEDDAAYLDWLNGLGDLSPRVLMAVELANRVFEWEIDAAIDEWESNKQDREYDRED